MYEGLSATRPAAVDPRIAPTPAWAERMRQRFPNERLVDRSLSRKLEQRLGPKYRPLTIQTAGEQLNGFFAGVLEGPFEVVDIEPLAGGSSKEQFAFRLRWSEAGTARDERLVLRMQPAQAVVETHRLREFQALAAIGSIVPVPKPYWVDSEGDSFQQPALIYGFCHGVARPPETQSMSTLKGGFGPKWRKILTPQFIETLARIHTFDPAGADLTAFEMPSIGTTESAIRGVNFSHRAWEEDRMEAIPLVTLTAAWLRRNAPVLDRISMVHGDYRPGNFLFDPEMEKITAVLDWELVRFGDRHKDLATILLAPLGDFDEEGNFLVCGLCPREEFIARYEEASGLPVDPARLTYYEILSYWSAVCTSLGSASRCMAAQKSHQDIVLGFNTLVAGMMLGCLQEALSKVLPDGA